MIFFKRKQIIQEQEKQIRSLSKQLSEAVENQKSLKSILFDGIDRFINQVYEAPPPVDVCILFQTAFIDDLVPESIEKLLKEVEPSFSNRLFEIIREKNLDEVAVYKKADIDRRHFSKIRSTDCYRPKKDTIILLCLSMKLSLEESQDLLSHAGYVLSRSLKTDIIAEYFLSRKIYDVMLYKETLFKYQLINEN